MRIKKIEQINKETIKMTIVVICIIGCLLEVLMPVLSGMSNRHMFRIEFLSLSKLRHVARYISLIIFCGIILLSDDNNEVKQNTKYLLGIQLVQLVILHDIMRMLTKFAMQHTYKAVGSNVVTQIIGYSQIPFSYFLLFVELALYIILLRKSKGLIKKIYFIMISIVIFTEIYIPIHEIIYICTGNNSQIPFYSTLIFRIIIALLYIACYLAIIYLIRTSDTPAIENKPTI